MGKHPQQRTCAEWACLSAAVGHFSRLLAVAVCRLRNFRSDRSCCPDKSDFFLVPPRLGWYAAADGVGATPQSHARRRLRCDPAPAHHAGWRAAVDIVLSTRDFNYDFAGAGHILIGHTFNECYQLEGSYTAVGESEDILAIRDNSPNALGGTGTSSPVRRLRHQSIAGLDYNNFAQIHYISSLQTGELNIRRHCRCRRKS